MTRQIILDTETTGFKYSGGDRIVEIGAVEIVDRAKTGNNYHQYINPQMIVPPDVIAVHGLATEFLIDKPVFSQIVDDFLEYIDGAEVIIHNATFDVNFLNSELKRIGGGRLGKLEDYCKITDTLKLAKQIYPGKKNNLDALCKRLEINDYDRDFHGALLDSEILGDVYLAMTGGQQKLNLEDEIKKQKLLLEEYKQDEPIKIKVVKATGFEQKEHNERINLK